MGAGAHAGKGGRGVLGAGGRVVLVANPASHAGKCAEEIPVVRDILRAMCVEHELRETTCLQDGYDFAAELSPADVVLSLGGDGIHAFVAGGAAASGCVMCPLPGGRGNDFVRSLGGYVQVAEQLALLTSGSVRSIDVGEIFVGSAGPRSFVGVACAGFDALANKYANEPLPFMRGRLAYTLGGVRALLGARPQGYVITVDGETHRVRARSVAVGQSGCYGGGLRTCPTALQDDGELDVTVVGDVSLLAHARILLKQFKGEHLACRGVRAFRGKSISVQTDGPHRVLYADGDEVGELPMSFEARERALRVLVP